MASQAEKCAWLKEHLVYEYDMLRYSFAVVTVLPEGNEWNVHYECFAIHSRLLRDFLANDGGSTNFQSNDFVEGYKSKPPNELGRRMDVMNAQVFHAGKSRAYGNNARKINSGDLRNMYDWIEPSMRAFASMLQSPYREAWNPNSAIPTTNVQSRGLSTNLSVGMSTPVAIGSVRAPIRTDDQD